MNAVPQPTAGHPYEEMLEGALNVEASSGPSARPRVRRRMGNGGTGRHRRRRLWTYGLVVVSAVLMVNALIGEKGYLANLQARQEYQEASESLQQLLSENERFADEIHKLRTDPQALEDEARQRLGLIKPGETLITLRDRQTPHK